MNLYQVLPVPSGSPLFSTVDDRSAILQTLSPRGIPWVRAIMVTNAGGETVGSDGSSRSLSQGADRALLGIYRDTADTVVVGASTIRRESVPTPRSATLVVLTRTGDMSGHRLVYRGDPGVVVVTLETASGRLEETFGDVPHTPLFLDSMELDSPAAILEQVSRVNHTSSVLIEGGRRTWELFEPVTNELCISVQPPLVSDQGGIPSWWPGDRDSWELQSLWTDDEKMLYYRYLTPHPARPQESR